MNGLSILLALGCLWELGHADSQTTATSASSGTLSTAAETTRVPPAIIVSSPFNSTSSSDAEHSISGCRVSQRIYRSSTAVITATPTSASGDSLHATPQQSTTDPGQSAKAVINGHENRVATQSAAAIQGNGSIGNRGLVLSGFTFALGIATAVALWA